MGDSRRDLIDVVFISSKFFVFFGLLQGVLLPSRVMVRTQRILANLFVLVFSRGASFSLPPMFTNHSPHPSICAVAAQSREYTAHGLHKRVVHFCFSSGKLIE